MIPSSEIISRNFGWCSLENLKNNFVHAWESKKIKLLNGAKVVK